MMLARSAGRRVSSRMRGRWSAARVSLVWISMGTPSEMTRVAMSSGVGI